MKERKRAPRRRVIELPKDHSLIFLEKDENVIAICTHKGCGNIVFKGSDKTQIENRILRERCLDHMTFFAEPHDVDVIYPRSGKIVAAEDLDPPQYTTNNNKPS